ncbi:MAG: endonuclease/exonuclease/phosphatase family protein [Candidatus Cloacimonadaceae bacterium]
MRIKPDSVTRLCLVMSILLSLLALSCGTNKQITQPDINDSLNLAFGTDSSFDLVTWNIENFPKHDPETSELLSNILPNLHADCIAVQEVANTSALYSLVNKMTGWSYRISSSGDTKTAILFNTATVQVDSFATIFTGMSNPFPRAPLLVRLHWQNQVIYLISMHLKAFGDNVIDASDPNDEEVRRQYACKLIDQYIERNLPDQKVIVVGDMNDQIQEPPSTNVFMTFINKPDEYCFADMSIAQHITEQNCSYPYYLSQLDHILITNELFSAFNTSGKYVRTLQIENYITPGGWSNYENMISDHRPVAARFIFSD